MVGIFNPAWKWNGYGGGGSRSNGGQVSEDGRHGPAGGEAVGEKLRGRQRDCLDHFAFCIFRFLEENLQYLKY